MDNLRFLLHKITLLLLFLWGGNEIFSQQSYVGTTKNKYPFYISVNYGITQFYGNINPGMSPFKDITDRTSTAYGITIEQKIFSWLSISGDAYWGNLKSKRDTTATTRKYTFNAQYLEQSLSFNLRPLALWENEPQKWDLFFSIGLGLAHFRGQTILTSSNTVFHSFGHGYGKGIGGRQIEGIFIGGGGFKYHISSNWDVLLQIKYKVLNISDLDGFPLYNKHEAYSFFGIGIAYRPVFKFNKRKTKLIDYEIKEVTNYQPFIKEDTAFINQKIRDSLYAVTLKNKQIEPDSTLDIMNQNKLVRMGYFPEAVYFNSNSAEIREDEILKIDKLVGILKSNASLKVIIEAYAETDGTEANPSVLSKSRAELVAKMMKDFYFLTPDRIILDYKNIRNPEFDNLFNSQKRVNFKIIKP